ncbi:MAG TPA: alkaline phosphatase D family protein [Nocardioides sp.]|nr:alkaline phosphatase D family protein [Nocardioides sp.]
MVIGRRTTLFAGVTAGVIPGLIGARLAPGFVRQRDRLVDGARTGEVTTDSAVVWSRAARDGQLHVQLRSNGRELRMIRGPWTDARVDRTARMRLTGLAPGREYDASVWFASADGTESTREELRFRTAPIHAAAQSVIWSGDTCGQGWGIDRARGGLTTYRAMLGLRPDLFVHVGDTIYGDEPMPESVRADDGSLWVNDLTEEVTTVAEKLTQFRGRHRYPLRDDNVRAFYAEVPAVVQWDDHETCNNWFPGETIDDERYTERSADVLAIRGRRAWQEYQPVPVTRLVPSDGDGFVPTRLYRRVPRGQHLDLFCLDMRSHRGPNTAARRGEVGILGRDQEDWLIDSLRRSTATWKVISADQPLSAPSTRETDLDGPANADDGRPLGREPELARVLSAIKRYGVRNVVWITTDVHYTAAHHYSPERAAYTDFDPFWELVSGPLAASPFWTKDDRLDGTFGPRVAFSKGEDTDRLDVTPRPDNQYFGHLAIAATGELTVTLYDGAGTALWSRLLEPEPSTS